MFRTAFPDKTFDSVPIGCSIARTHVMHIVRPNVNRYRCDARCYLAAWHVLAIALFVEDEGVSTIVLGDMSIIRCACLHGRLPSPQRARCHKCRCREFERGLARRGVVASGCFPRIERLACCNAEHC